jgi:predicted RNase H-like nuclease (RuvC/YqgF family)
MTKEEVIKALEDAKVDISLTKDGEIRADLLELALDGVNARAGKEALAEELNAYEENIDRLTKRCEELHDELEKTKVNANNVEVYETTIDTLNKRIEELEEQKTPAEKANLVYFKKEKKKYRLTLPSTNFRGKKINAEILNKDQSLLEELIATGTSLLVEEGKEA